VPSVAPRDPESWQFAWPKRLTTTSTTTNCLIVPSRGRSRRTSPPSFPRPSRSTASRNASFDALMSWRQAIRWTHPIQDFDHGLAPIDFETKEDSNLGMQPSTNRLKFEISRISGHQRFSRPVRSKIITHSSSIAALLTPDKANEHHKFCHRHCQNSFGEARHHENWGISNAIVWEKLFRRRHLFNWDVSKTFVASEFLRTSAAKDAFVSAGGPARLATCLGLASRFAEL
jgi:hypothetical protein